MKLAAFYVRQESVLKPLSTLVFANRGDRSPVIRGALESRERRGTWVYRNLQSSTQEQEIVFTVNRKSTSVLSSEVRVNDVAVGEITSKVLGLVRTKWLVKQGDHRFVGRERWLLVALLRDALPWLLSSTFDLKDERGRRVARFVLERGMRPGIHAYIDDDSLDPRLAVALAAQMAHLEDSG